MTVIENFNRTRKQLNLLMQEHDIFFTLFGSLDDAVYADGNIPKKYKELMGLAISIASRCPECVNYHVQECLGMQATGGEMIEAIKIGVIGGGSITYPTARHAFQLLEELSALSTYSKSF